MKLQNPWSLAVTLFRLLIFCSEVQVPYLLLVSFKTWPIGLPYP